MEIVSSSLFPERFSQEIVVSLAAEIMVGALLSMIINEASLVDELPEQSNAVNR